MASRQAEPKWVDPEKMTGRLASTMKRLIGMDNDGLLAAPVDPTYLFRNGKIAQFGRIDVDHAELTKRKRVVVAGDLVVKHLDMRSDVLVVLGDVFAASVDLRGSMVVGGKMNVTGDLCGIGSEALTVLGKASIGRAIMRCEYIMQFLGGGSIETLADEDDGGEELLKILVEAGSKIRVGVVTDWVDRMEEPCEDADDERGAPEPAAPPVAVDRREPTADEVIDDVRKGTSTLCEVLWSNAGHEDIVRIVRTLAGEGADLLEFSEELQQRSSATNALFALINAQDQSELIEERPDQFVDLMKILVGAGIDPAQKNRDGHNALINCLRVLNGVLSYRMNEPENKQTVGKIWQVFMDAGLDPEEPDSDGFRPYDYVPWLRPE